ncbi:MAG: LemA family protein [Flavobacterium sp.]|nr:LemA family protein [Flavobacterium sp.]
MITIPILLLLALYFSVKAYNTIIRKRNQVENALAGTDAILKKRYDLIPNLVSAVKQYMTYEEATLSKITSLRTSLLEQNSNVSERLEKENQLSSLLGKVLVAVENYPDLKSNTNMLHLQQSLMEIEEQISAARRSYNASVMDYNNSIEAFPANIIAGFMGAKRKPSFEINTVERETVSVKDLFDAK